jgi:hypothetical protein
LAGVLALTPAPMARTTVAKVECPECGATRTLQPHGNTATFPTHAKRLTRTPHKDVRWLRQGTPGALSHRPAERPSTTAGWCTPSHAALLPSPASPL